MPKTMRSKEETTRYLSDKDNMKVFVRELHEYLRKHMYCTTDENGKKIWWCHSEEEDKFKYFIKFCKKMCLDREAVDAMFQYKPGDYWCNCDCNYLYGIKIDDDGNTYFKI